MALPVVSESSSEIKSDSDKITYYYNKYCHILGYSEDGKLLKKCWDPYSFADVMPLFDFEVTYVNVHQKHPNPSFQDVVLGIKVLGCYPLSLIDLVKTPQEIRQELESSSELRSVFKNARSLIQNFDTIQNIFSSKKYILDYSEVEARAFLCVHYLEKLNPVIINTEPAKCPHCAYWTKCGNTTIGSPDQTLHGDLDMLIGSGFNTAACFVSPLDCDNEDDLSDSRPGLLTNPDNPQEYLCKVVSQAIVFGFTEGNRHCGDAPFPKTIMIDKTSFTVFFYDTNNDILLKSQSYLLNDENAVYLLAILLNFNHFFRKPDLSLCSKSGFQGIMRNLGLLDPYTRLKKFDRKRKGEHIVEEGEYICERRRKAEC